MENFQNIAVTLMILTVLAETIVSSLHQLELFDVRDTLANILLGVFTIVVGMAMKGLTLNIFMGMESIAVMDLRFTWGAAIVLFIVSDFYYFAFHVLAHRCRFVWASHVVHHSSGKFNLTVAIRLPFTNGLYRFTFWAPLCMIGFDPAMVMLMDTIVVFYTFFLHTETIGKLGWLEKVLNTPSHHRVHHSSNPAYLDKNFGGVLIIWDRLFGTFAEEEEKPRYGITSNFQSYNPVTILCDEWIKIYRDLVAARSLRRALFVVFGNPASIGKSKPEMPKAEQSSNGSVVQWNNRPIVQNITESFRH